MSDDHLEQAQKFATLAADEADHDEDRARTYALVAIANALASLAWTADLGLPPRE